MGLASTNQVLEERRVRQRMPLRRPAVLCLVNGLRSATFDVTLADLTRDGCRIDTVENLPSGAEVEIGIANVGRTTGWLVWHDGTGYGCEFTNPLPRGAVTAASSLSNLISFPQDLQPATKPPASVKFSPRTNLLLPVVVSVALWGMILSLVGLDLR